jgi:hypothetical protein
MASLRCPGGVADVAQRPGDEPGETTMLIASDTPTVTSIGNK